ncbi:MAG: hypothetical protein IPJ77_16205 [Planctomycetes bacterium]|nr:hypothetical protein [Planctomycetota bacterium]
MLEALLPRGRGRLGAALLTVLLAVGSGAFAAARRGPSASGALPVAPAGAEHVRGVTISCETWGWEWGSDAFAADLDRLKGLGVNWVAIHPYARIRADGEVSARDFDPDHPPEWITRPIREAHARGLALFVIPHLAYWGSPWSWRGEIEFQDPAARARFFASYQAWITGVARAARGADGFSIANELEKLAGFEAEWRAVIAAVRAETPARLTWAANWSGYRDVRFWDALDAVGVQAYFPLVEHADPTEDELRAAWKPVLAELATFQARVGKPIVFTELGYRAALDAAREPWTFREARGDERARAEAVQERCLTIALEAIEPESAWLRGAFLWKWFPGSARRGENFLVNRPGMQRVVERVWKPAAERADEAAPR